TISPRGSPTHNVLGGGFFPKGKILRIFLFALPIQISSIFEKFFDISSGKFSVIHSSFVVFQHIKINRTITFVSKTFVNQLLSKLQLLNNMSSCRRLDGWRK